MFNDTRILDSWQQKYNSIVNSAEIVEAHSSDLEGLKVVVVLTYDIDVIGKQ
jgi:hypothetical protein